MEFATFSSKMGILRKGKNLDKKIIGCLINKRLLKADRMSCNKFTANQFRLYLHCAAYVILHSFQADMLAGTELECSTITTMREKLLLSAVSIDEKKTCIRIRFSQKAPMLPEMVSVLTRLRHLPPS